MTKKIFLILFYLSCNFVMGQSLEFKIKHFSINDGLSNNTVRNAVQDSLGFIWLLTEVGLNRFDGYSFKTYFNVPGDSTSIQVNDVRSLHIDKNGNMWINSAQGVSRYIRESDSFKRYNCAGERSQFINLDITFPEDSTNYSGLLLGSSGVFSYLNDTDKFIKQNIPVADSLLKTSSLPLSFLKNQNELWFPDRVKGILYCYDLITGNIAEYNLFENLGLKIKNLNYLSVAEFSFGIIIRTNNLLSIYDKETKKIIPFTKFGKKLTNVGYITQIFEDSKFRLWIATTDGLFLLKGNEVYSYTEDNINPILKISNNNASKIIEDSKGRIHVLTENGYNILSRFDEGFIKVSANINCTNWFDQNAFYSLEELKSGEFILTSKYNGFSIINVNNRAVKKYFPKLNLNSLAQATIYSVLEDKKNNLWISTLDSGLCKYDRENNKWTNIKIAPQITAELIDEMGNIWLGLRGGGLKKYDERKNVITSFDGVIDGVKMKTVYIRSLFQLNNDSLLVGTRGVGLFLFNMRTNKYEKRILHFNDKSFELNGTSYLANNVLIIKRIDENLFWIGTDYGFYKFNVKSEKVVEQYAKEESKNSLGGNSVFDIHKDSYNQLWIGTYDGGLSLFLGKDKGFKNFGRETEVKFNTVHAITENNNRMLWFTTTNGIMKINPMTHEIKRYSKKDGFLGNEYNTGALATLSTGEIAAGGVDGLNIFHPDSLKENKNIPKMAFTKFSVNNQEVKLIPDIAVSEEVDVDYDKKIITFEFAAFNYINTEDNEYQYKLEGLSEKWNKIGKQHSVTFTNLEPNDYVLRVKGSNNDGYWNEEGISIKLSVIPPFWMTTWFYILIFLLAIIPVLIIAKLRIDKYKMIEITRSRIAENLHDEFGGKLSSIYFMATLLQTKNDVKNNTEINKLVGRISEQSVSIGDDFRDVVWSLNPENDDWESLLIKYQRFASDILETKDINHKITVPKLFPKKEMNSEKKLNYLLLIKEITNNIVKHSEAKNVTIEISFYKNSIKTVITDDGVGFDVNRVDKGNGIINIKKRIKILVAQYKLTSKKEKGTNWEIIFEY